MIKFLDLQKINFKYLKKLKLIANEIIESGWYILGNKTQKFEEELSNYIGSKQSIVCAHGLDASRLIIRGYIDLNVFKKGDENMVPVNTYIAAIVAITENRLKPI